MRLSLHTPGLSQVKATTAAMVHVSIQGHPLGIMLLMAC